MHEKHADDGHGQGEDDGPDGALPQASVLLVVRLFRPVFQLFAVVAHQQVVTCSLQGRFQLFGAALCRVVFHGGRGRRVVDGSRAHPRLSVLSTRAAQAAQLMSNTGNVLFSMCIVSIVFIVSMVVGYKDKYRVCKLSYRIMASFYMF